jgi:hypothetical protein
MTNNNTRTRLLQAWLVVATLAIGMWIASGGPFSPSAVVGVLALVCAPPVMLTMLWPSVEPETAGDIIRGGQPPKA